MPNRSATLICYAADKATAEDLADNYPGGAGSFGPGAVKLSTTQGTTVPTHFAVSGQMDADMVDAFEVSSVPIYMVLDLNGTTFDAQLAKCVPQLYRCIEDEPV